MTKTHVSFSIKFSTTALQHDLLILFSWNFMYPDCFSTSAVLHLCVTCNVFVIDLFPVSICLKFYMKTLFLTDFCHTFAHEKMALQATCEKFGLLSTSHWSNN